MAGRLIKRFVSLKTPLYDMHLLKEARFETKNDYWMPRFYNSTQIDDEYLSCVNNSVIYDQGAMGQVVISGKDRLEFINHISVSDFSSLYPGCPSHSLLLNDNGHILDRIIIAQNDDSSRIISFNKNTEKYIYKCREDFIKKGKNVEVETLAESLISIQGPKSKTFLGSALRHIRPYSFSSKHCFLTAFKAFNNEWAFITWLDFSRHSGFLISMKTEKIPMLVDFLQIISKKQAQIASLETQRIMRIEAGFWNEEELIVPINPIEVNWKLTEEKLKSTSWIGAEAVKQLLLKENHDKLVKFEINGSHHGLHGSNIFDGFKRQAGTILSIVYHPIQKKTIGFCIIKQKYITEPKKLYIVGEVPLNIIM
ncbi:unnamed protein product [Blepharisma stoltei]|uniref:GCVT N-terminal domain-containing protein n=1 Tax=Blepharisma stoltei TaxID=1481888 RepID=A0AAU9J2F2_9CILI|nr:unnamed protein product [Blepharisma stoltei]